MDLAHTRNIGVVAHIDAGKTTVTERILFYTGVEHRIGEVHDGTATMDWMDEERERGITITAAATACDWQGYRLQLIDTPGHVDFTVEVERSLRVLDGAIVVLDAVAGVQPQTETVLRQAARHHVPLLMFVNKMDRLGADFAKAVSSVRERLKLTPVPVQLPVGAGAEFEGVIDLIERQLLRWGGEHGQNVERRPIPEERLPEVEQARDELCASVAEMDDALTDLYLENGELNAEQLHRGLRQATLARKLVPVLIGAALRNIGIQPLLDGVTAWLPSPLQRVSVTGQAPDGQEVQRCPDPDAPLAALVFKIFHEAYGDLHYVRVYSGLLKERQRLVVARTGRVERVGQLLLMHADHRVQIAEAGPGAIVAISGLKFAQTGDTLCVKGEEIALEGMEFPEAVMRVTVETNEPKDADKLLDALRILEREDPTLQLSLDPDSGQNLLAGMGELHLEVVLHRLQREFGVSARAGQPQVSYRESVVQVADGHGEMEIPGDEHALRVKASLRLHPTEVAGLEFRGGDLWAELPESLRLELPAGGLSGDCGPIGFPLTGVVVELTALSWTPMEVEPSVGAIAGAFSRAMREALAGVTQVREPVMDLAVQVPEGAFSAVLSDLNARGGEIQQVDPAEGQVRARVPMERMFAYSTQLRSLTQGKGEFSMEPAGYAAPSAARWAEKSQQMGLSGPDSSGSA
jgi:elongation factor G